MKLSKILCIALALTLALAVFAGCKKDETTPTPEPNKVNNTPDPGSKIINPNRPTNTPLAPVGSSSPSKITPDPSTSAEPTTSEASQVPAESETPEASIAATDDGSGN